MKSFKEMYGIDVIERFSRKSLYRALNKKIKVIGLYSPYLLAYDKGCWGVVLLKQRRSHRGCSGQMDDDIEKLYFPCGRSGEASDVEVDNIENYGDVVEAMLLLSATPNVELE